MMSLAFIAVLLLLGPGRGSSRRNSALPRMVPAAEQTATMFRAAGQIFALRRSTSEGASAADSVRDGLSPAALRGGKSGQVKRGRRRVRVKNPRRQKSGVAAVGIGSTS
jgi:hypothetical protein